MALARALRLFLPLSPSPAYLCDAPDHFINRLLLVYQKVGIKTTSALQSARNLPKYSIYLVHTWPTI